MATDAYSDAMGVILIRQEGHPNEKDSIAKNVESVGLRFLFFATDFFLTVKSYHRRREIKQTTLTSQELPPEDTLHTARW